MFIESKSGVHFVPEQSFTVYGLVLNLHFALSADLSALNNTSIKKFSIFLFTLPDSTRTDLTLFFLKLPEPGPTFVFPFRHNTSLYVCRYPIYINVVNFHAFEVDLYNFG